jgi:hypothetical protein
MNKYFEQKTENYFTQNTKESTKKDSAEKIKSYDKVEIGKEYSRKTSSSRVVGYVTKQD